MLAFYRRVWHTKGSKSAQLPPPPGSLLGLTSPPQPGWIQWPFSAVRIQGLISTACIMMYSPVLYPTKPCLIPLCILHVQGSSWHAPFAFGNISWMNGQTFTNSNQAWLVNTTRIEVREMWFIFAIKCLHITHKNTVCFMIFFNLLCHYAHKSPRGWKGL